MQMQCKCMKMECKCNAKHYYKRKEKKNKIKRNIYSFSLRSKEYSLTSNKKSNLYGNN